MPWVTTAAGNSFQSPNSMNRVYKKKYLAPSVPYGILCSLNEWPLVASSLVATQVNLGNEQQRSMLNCADSKAIKFIRRTRRTMLKNLMLKDRQLFNDCP